MKTLKTIAWEIWNKKYLGEEFSHIYKKNTYHIRIKISYSFINSDIKKILLNEIEYSINNESKTEFYNWFGTPTKCLRGLSSEDSLYQRLKNDIEKIIKNKRKHWVYKDYL
ncbi:hypothetical protein [Campylobacter volucris]|uniref:hypothetical protein n=1 Tax=Campylobacter volucris TaxID=1031542 RepID=UPI00189C9356|nr:hypothetical protein [Campylobacter volucris]MBF7048138.1 hypothetical protein [Campylobacter volucris]